MTQPRMLMGGAALALLMGGNLIVQGCRNGASAPVPVTLSGGTAPRAAAATVPASPVVPSPLSPASGAVASAAPAAPAPSAPPEPVGILIHVVGAVRHPGLYHLPAGARLADALHAAGGPKTGADLEAVNLAS